MKRRKMLKDKDIPRWLSALLLTMFFCAIPVYIYLVNPTYLTHTTGYANGIETYTHTVEALHTKNLLQNAVTNFWFDSGSLGYPLLLTTQMFPNFIIAVIMMVFERWITPLLMFRWIIVLLLSLLPAVWYKAARNFRFSRTQSILLAVLTLSIDSQLQIGFELDAYFLHGHVPQLFAMLFMPLAASKIYLHGLCLDNQDHSRSVFYTCLVYLSHIRVGFFCTCVTLVTTFLFMLAKEFNKRNVKEAIKRFLYFHFSIFIYLSWWVIPLAISFSYHIEAYKTFQSFTLSSLIDTFTNGGFYDYRQNYVWFTCLVTLGFCIVVKNLRGVSNFYTLQINQNQLFTAWLLSVSFVSIVLFIECSFTKLFQRVLPFDMNADGSIYLLALHFCGLLFASIPLASVGDVLSFFTIRTSVKKMVNITFVVLFSLLMIRHSALRVSERVTMVQVEKAFVETLGSIKAIPKDGRLLAHEKFGSGGPWDVVNIPFLTGKPGVFLPGNKETLSSFYLEKLLLNYDTEVLQDEFVNLLSLFNVQFLVSSAVAMDALGFDRNIFRHIKSIYDIQFYQVDPDNFNYGYFDVVRIPGYVSGDLKEIRPAVSDSLTLFSREIALYLNPSADSEIRKQNKIFSDFDKDGNGFSVKRWVYDGQTSHSEVAIKQLKSEYARKWSSSIIVEQIHHESEYHVIVHVTNHNDTTFDLVEHVLLKVAYHPFWRCTYFPIEDKHYTLYDYDPNRKLENRKYATVHHVTPNMMAVTLPRGKYHVIFKYRFPGILKLMAVVLMMLLIDAGLKYELRSRLFRASYFLYKLFTSTHYFVVSNTKICVKFFLQDDLSLKKIFSKLSLHDFFGKYGVSLKEIKRKASPEVLFDYEPLTKCMDFPVKVMQEKNSEYNFSSNENLLKQECIEEKDLAQRCPIDNECSDFDDRFFTPSTHMTKSSRKRMNRRESAASQEKLIETFIDDVIQKELKSVSSELFDIVNKTSSNCDLKDEDSCNENPRIAENENTQEKMSIISDEEAGDSSNCESISPENMITEDFYISDSYVYQSDVFNEEEDNVTQMSENTFLSVPMLSIDEDENYSKSEDTFYDAFRTTLVPDKDDFEDELDLNRSLEICCFYDSPLSSRSNSSLSENENNSREFSSSPDEHSSPDNSFEYNRRDVDHTEDDSQKNDVVLSSDLYRIYMPENSIPSSSTQEHIRHSSLTPTATNEIRNLPLRSNTVEY